MKLDDSKKTIGEIVSNINLELETLFNNGELVNEDKLDSIIEKYGIPPKFFKGRSHIAFEIIGVVKIKANRKNIASAYHTNRVMSYTKLTILTSSIVDVDSKTYNQLLEIHKSIKKAKKEKEDNLKEERLDNFLNVLNENALTVSQFKEILDSYRLLTHKQTTEL